MKTLIVLLITISMNAQQLPKHINLPELGLSFNLPDGWNGQLEGEMLVLGHQMIPGLMVVSQNNSKTAQQLKDLAMQGIAMDGVVLNPIEDFVIKNDTRVEGMYHGTFNGANVKCYAIGLINGLGSGLNILILTETDKFTEQHTEVANTLASSVVFKQAQDKQATAHWKQKIMGMQLKYSSTQSSSDFTGGSTSITTKEIIDLCADGSFHYYYYASNSFSAGDTNAEAGSTNEQSGFGHSNSQSDTTGTYIIYTMGNTTILELSFENGKMTEYMLTENEDGNTFLEGSRYFISSSKVCN